MSNFSFSHSVFKTCTADTLKPGLVWERIKGGYLDFSHLTELKNIYITEIYIKKKQYKSSITKNHKIKKKIFFDGIPFKGYVAS